MYAYQVSDELGSTPRDLLLSREGPVQRFDLMAGSASLLSKAIEPGEISQGPEACGQKPASASSEAWLSSIQAAISSTASLSHQWPLKDMRVLLAAAGVNTSG